MYGYSMSTCLQTLDKILMTCSNEVVKTILLLLENSEFGALSKILGHGNQSLNTTLDLE